MKKLSVVIITKNEEKNLARCLESVQSVADEIIVLDSFSEDRTVEIAEGFGAMVVKHSFLGYVKQKNLANQYASFDWILSLDADEALSPDLSLEIKGLKEHGADFGAYSLPRLTNYCGSWIRHSGWYPDRKLRLFNKHLGAWQGDMIHERWEFHEKQPQGQLWSDLYHYSYYTLSDHILQIEKFTEIAARAAVAKGKRCSVWKMSLVPFFNFFRDYFFRLGILDGMGGYYVCKLSAFASFVKYSKIREYSRQEQKSAFRGALPQVASFNETH